MEFTKTLRATYSVLGLVAFLTGCSNTVRWQEEVPLNTGEKIVVERVAKFKRGTEPGNPLKPAWWPDGGSIRFNLHGQYYTYDYHGRMNVFGIYVETKETPSIIDSTGPRCDHPGLGEYRWANGVWVLQGTVPRNLIGMPRNLMFAEPYPGLDEPPAYVTAAYRVSVDTSLFANRSSAGIRSQAVL